MGGERCPPRLFAAKENTTASSSGVVCGRSGNSRSLNSSRSAQPQSRPQPQPRGTARCHDSATKSAEHPGAAGSRFRQGVTCSLLHRSACVPARPPVRWYARRYGRRDERRTRSRHAQHQLCSTDHRRCALEVQLERRSCGVAAQASGTRLAGGRYVMQLRMRDEGTPPAGSAGVGGQQESRGAP